eukprot:TRINITY_DN817_c0_g3_i1.p1 TRINITY_DN817_c0_g3~~TRINITY_DN817_c0_g3_i1.p1  ORF type:complete len:141 (-),score=4.73 TRINITY_DN817_c0_g3_i1:59-481(-)
MEVGCLQNWKCRVEVNNCSLIGNVWLQPCMNASFRCVKLGTYKVRESWIFTYDEGVLAVGLFLVCSGCNYSQIHSGKCLCEYALKRFGGTPLKVRVCVYALERFVGYTFADVYELGKTEGRGRSSFIDSSRSFAFNPLLM